MQRMEERLGWLLSIGTGVSSALLVAGLVLWFAAGAGPLTQRTLEAGLIVLIATPVGRVVASTIGFLVQRDWQMVTMTGLVLLSLVLSVLVAYS
jgi:uncharacterized membrane protein